MSHMVSFKTLASGWYRCNACSEKGRRESLPGHRAWHTMNVRKHLESLAREKEEEKQQATARARYKDDESRQELAIRRSFWNRN